MREPIAIIGIGCRFPGQAISPAAFWRLLVEGVDAIREIPPDRFKLADVYDSDPSVPGKTYSRWGAFVDGIDQFDPGFFGFSRREAIRIDPQHRMLLETTWEAFEDARLRAERLGGSATGVFVGISTHDYPDMQAYPWNRALIDAHTNSGGAVSIASNRISYVYDLRGPSFSVDTACSSSLVAAHLACQSLWNGECDLALVGGVQAVLTPEVSIGFSKASMLSPDGRCKAFAAEANGYVRGEGAGALVLKPLGRAVSDGDRIYALIRGSAINEDGRTNGMTVPSLSAQQAVLHDAYRRCGVRPGDVHYVEAHGTGTVVGDPIEAEALGTVLASARPAGEVLRIGSVKTNIGHLEAASGIAGLIKAALTLHHRWIPPSLHARNPNPAIPFADLRLRVVGAGEAWPDDAPAFAGVNSFGFGGANAHVVLEGAPPSTRGTSQTTAETQDAAAPGDEPSQLLIMSARSPASLQRLARAYRDMLLDPGAADLIDLTAAAALERTHHDYRLGIVGSDRDTIADHLDAFVNGEPRADVVSGRAPHGAATGIVFVFTGMGPPWWAMARSLLAGEAVFRAVVDECDRLFRRHGSWSLLDELMADEARSRVSGAELAPPANFAIQAGLLALWKSWGVTPAAVVGHSAGEIAAAYASGALDLEDAARVAFYRGFLQQRASGLGGMMAAGERLELLQPLLDRYPGRVAVAAINSPTSVTLCGDSDAIAEIAAALEQQRTFCRVMSVDVPYHSHHLDAIRGDTLAVLAELRTHRPSVPIVSEVTGEWMRDEPFDAAYWWRNTRETVRFADAVLRLVADGYTTFLEVGPHPVLAASITECLKHAGVDGTCLPSLRRNEEDRRILLRTTAALHARGVPIEWERVLGRPRRRVELPSYPWNKERVWFEGARIDTSVTEAPRDHTRILGSRVRAVQPHWETNLASPALAYISDHRIHDAIVFPGAAYVAMALDAATELGYENPTLEHVEFRKALFLPDDMRTRLQTVFESSSGELSVHAQPDEDGEAPWIAHATSRILRGAGETRTRVMLEEVRARCTTPLTRDAFYAELTQRGFTFGRRFEGLESIHMGDGEALGFVRLPDSHPVELTGRVHPALFDAGLQVLIAAVMSRQAAGSRQPGFLPTRAARVASHASIGASFWSHARLAESIADGFEGSVTVFDEAGACLLEIDGLRAKTLESADETARSAAAGRHTYELRWEERQLTTAPAPSEAAWCSPAAVAARANAEADRLSADSGFAGYYREVEPRLEAITRAFFVKALVAVGADLRPGSRFGTVILPDNSPLIGARRRQFDALIDALQEAEILSRDGDTARVAATPPADDPLQLVAKCRRRHPAFNGVLDVIVRCGDALADVLRGRRTGPDVLFSDEGAPLMRAFYRDAPNTRLFNALMADALSFALEGSPAERGLRVLEVGAGTGGATHHLLSRLRARGNFQYAFTDISPLFVAAAQADFGSSPEMRYTTLDLERVPQGQGFQPHTFDVVCAANVIHATRDVAKSLAHLRTLLAPGGLLVLQEITRGPRWLDLVFGITDGWWAFDDAPLRKTRAILDVEAWHRVLTAAGFEEPSVIVEHEDPIPGQSVLVARAPSSREVNRPWLVLADRGGFGERIAEGLRQSGHRVSVANAADADSMTTAVAVAQEHGGLNGVIHCGSVEMTAVNADTPSAAIVSDQAYGACALIELIQACQANGCLPSRVAIVTAGAQPVDPATETAAIAQSPLWGLGRVLLLEQPLTAPVLIDCSAAPTADEIDGVVREALADVRENEVALRGLARYVRRVVPLDVDAPPPESIAVAPADGRRYRAEVAVSGSLDGVCLRETRSRELTADEIEIEVKAASLNFRDVMFTMGMLPAAAFDSMLSAGALGVDCAGVVSRVGSAVTDVGPGDEVIALSPASLASHAITKDLVARKPAGMTFAEAAALPLAYVTAIYALERVAQLRQGERVLIHSSTGGVGLAALAVANRAGAEIFATAGSDAKRAYLRERGIRHVMDSRTLDFVEQIKTVTGGRGVDVVLNSLAGEAIRGGLSVLAPRGRFLEIGKADIYRRAELPLDAFRDNISFAAIQIDVLSNSNRVLLRDLLHEVTRGIENGTLPPLPQQTVPAHALSEGLRLLAQARHTGKIVIGFTDRQVPIESSTEPAPVFRPDASYLIAGGRGGVGLALADWAVARGARRLVLMSRSASAADGHDAVASMRARGAEVRLFDGDLTRLSDVERAIAAADLEAAPLKGVFHAAMVMDDCGFAELDGARFTTVMAPKVEGGWNLHRATLGRSLDHFVLFSSITSVWGNARQGSYAAANAFLDALAAHRHAHGLPALSINFGVFSSVGYVAQRPDLTAFLERQGQTGLPLERAFEAMAALMRRGTVHAAVSQTDWRAWADWNPVAGSSPKFSIVVQAPVEAEGARPRDSGRLLDQLLAHPPDGRTEEVTQHLRRSVAKILGAAPDRVEFDVPLTDMGMDSLMAVEFGIVLRHDFAMEVPVVRLLKGVTVQDLTGMVGALLESKCASPEPRSNAAVTSASQPDRAVPAGTSAPGASVPSSPVMGARSIRDVPPVDPAFATWTPLQRVARAVVTRFTRMIANVQIDGSENAPERGGFVIAANHISMWDAPVLLCAADRPVIMFAAEELRQRAFMHWTLHRIWNAIYLRRGEGDLQALEKGVDILRRGGRLGLAPEGHRSRTGLQSALTGVAFLAYRAGVPTLPVAVYGQERIVESCRRLRRASVHVRIGSPVPAPTGEPTPDALRAHTERVMVAIARLLPREYRGRYTAAAEQAAEPVIEIA